MSEEILVRNCSPTLAGLKTGNIFNCPYETNVQLMNEIRVWNRKLSCKGLLIIPLRFTDKKALIYVCRLTKLKADFLCEAVCAILKEYGYPFEKPERCIVELRNRLRQEEGFPHEIGLFLGYPPEDVRGFIENDARSSKCIGCWKVYGDEEKAKRLFHLYKKCTNVYMEQLIKGKSIERLTVAV
jgi:hypothetical protein